MITYTQYKAEIEQTIISATIIINQEIKNKTTTRWKKGKTDDSTKYNNILEETWNQIPQRNKNYQHLENHDKRHAEIYWEDNNQ